MLIASAVSFALQAPLQHATLHPSAPVLYIETPDVQRLLEAYHDAPLGQMLRDESVRAAWSKIASALDLKLDVQFDATLEALGMPPSADQHGVDALLARARTTRSLSLSIGIDERAPGELAAALKSRVDTYTELASLEDAIVAHARTREGRVPAALAELELAADVATDAWSRPYVYAPSDDGFGYTLQSLGSNGVEGGVGEAADISAAVTLEDWLASEMQRRFFVLVAVEFTSDQGAADAAAAIARIAPALDGAVIREVNMRGKPARAQPFHTEAPLSLDGWVLRSDALVVAGLGAVDCDAVAARASASTTSSDLISQLTTLDTHAGPASGVTVVRFSAQTARLNDIAKGVNAPGGAALLGLLGSLNGWSTVARMQLVGERFVTDGWTTHSGAAFWTDSIGAAPVSKEIVAFVPDDAAGVLVTQLAPAQLRDQLLSLMGGNSASLTEVETKHGFSLEKDLIGSLAGPAAVYVMPITGIGLPNVTLVLDLTDAVAFQRGVRGLVAVLSEQGQKVKESKYRDAPMWTLAMGEEAAALPFLSVSPTIFIIGKRALVTLTSLRAKKEVKRALGEEAANPHPLTKLAVPPPDDAAVVGYMDWAVFIDSLYLAAKGGLALAGGALGGNVPFDINALGAALPESATTFTRFFKPTLLWSKSVDGRTLFRYESSFGPETWLGIAALGYGVTSTLRDAAPETMSSPDEIAPPPEDPSADRTRATLAYLTTRVAVFKLDQGRAPTELAELCKPTANYPRGFVDADVLPNDGWGNAFHYNSNTNAAPMLWSSGADSVDAGGTGDDIVAP